MHLQDVSPYQEVTVSISQRRPGVVLKPAWQPVPSRVPRTLQPPGAQG